MDSIKSNVYFADTRTTGQDNSLIAKTKKLFDRLYQECAFIQPQDLTGIKVHFGELGLSTFLSPVFARTIVNKVKGRKASPFLFDTATLYLSGSRANAVDHVNTALSNGFSPVTTGAPIIIADGLSGHNHFPITVDGKHFTEVKLAADLQHMDSIVCLSHLTGHCGTGFGAALKTISMGLACRAGKLAMHSDTKPFIKTKTCNGCQVCIPCCPVAAIKIENKKAQIDTEICIGCMRCDRHCPQRAISFHWDSPEELIMEKMAEYAAGVIKTKKGKMIFINYLINITPDCDCFPYSDAPFVQDIGITASLDPVAVDQASADLVNAQPGLKNTALAKERPAGNDNIRALWPKINWQHLLDYSENLGLGTKDYQLVKI